MFILSSLTVIYLFFNLLNVQEYLQMTIPTEIFNLF